MSKTLADLIAEDREKEKNKPGAAEIIARGVAQGATMGFGDELTAAAKALDIDPAMLSASALAGPWGPTLYGSVQAAQKLIRNPSQIVPQYRSTLAEGRTKNKAAQETGPGKYLIGQVGGGLASAMIPGVGAPATAGKAIAAGAGYGALSGLGESEADLTKGETGEAAKDVGIGALIGAGGAGLVSAGKSALSRALPSFAAKRAAREVAQETATPSAGSGYKKTIGESFGVARELEDEVTRTIGEKFKLTPAQATGKPSLALGEHVAEQLPGTMDTAQAFKHKQLEQWSRFIDSQVDAIAKKPELLGNAGVSEKVGKTLEGHITALRDARSKAAKPFYDKFKQLSENAKVPIANSLAVIKEEIAQLGSGPGRRSMGPLRDTLNAIESGRFDEINSALSWWSNASRSRGTVLDQLGDAQKTRIARNISEALNKDLDDASKGFGRTVDGRWVSTKAKEAAESLKEGRRLWRMFSEQIDSDATDTVSRMLDVAGSDASDTLVSKLGKMSPQQVSGVFNVLNKQSPDVAALTRAQLFEDILVRSGKGARGETIATELGVSELSPRTLLTSLKRAEPMLQAAFAGDNAAKMALRKTMMLAQKLSFGPGLKGSQSVPMLSQMAENFATDAAAASAGMPGLGGMLRTVFSSEKATAKALQDPVHIETFNKALETFLKKGSSDKSAAAAIAGLTRLGIGIKSELEQDKVKP